MSHNQEHTFLLEVWHGHREQFKRSNIQISIWSNDDLLGFNQCFDYHYTFVGKTATVHVGTNDYEIEREDALWCARRFMDGQLEFRFVDFMTGRVIERKSDEFTDNPR